MKPKLIFFTGHYAPGFKAGGILTNMINTLNHLSCEYDIWVVTRDRDLSDNVNYNGVETDIWQRVDNANVIYLSPKNINITYINRLLKSYKFDVIILNGFFEIFTIFVLVCRKLFRDRAKNYVVSPFGEFAPASFNQKKLKKIIYIKVGSFLRLYENVNWKASSTFEALDLIRELNINEKKIHLVPDLPRKNCSIPRFDLDARTKVIFLSRIAKEKNLDYALNILSKVKSNIIFDIYGPIENKVYWDYCVRLFNKIPPNVKIEYKGVVNSGEILATFAKYDLFFFPTSGEAYGNVIAESLTCGTPVLLSTETPWRNLSEDLLGWDIDLKNEENFIDRIEYVANLSRELKNEMKHNVLNNFKKFLNSEELVALNIDFYNSLL
jgi:glycosyltransferase involved in cell wall biosynthesis